MIEAMTFDLSEDLRPLSHYLMMRNIPHRISEQAGKQVVWVPSEAHAEAVKQAYRDLPSMPDVVKGLRPAGTLRQGANLSKALADLLASPWITLLVLASIVTTLLMGTGLRSEIIALMRMGSPAYVAESGEYWRLISPIFLHFSILHVVFNMLMLWVFGHLIERREGTGMTIAITLAIALISNLAQYWVTGSNFGGMSGVVYGVMGYCWLWDRLSAARPYNFPPALMGFMLFWLALGYTDLTDYLGLGSMANAAHLLGLIAGLALALLRRGLKALLTQSK